MSERERIDEDHQLAPPAMPRSRFLNLILGTGAGGLAAAVLYPVGRYIVPPEAPESAANSVVLSLSPDDVPPNTGQIFKFGSKPGILIRTPGGELRAFTAVCTHLDCTVQYREDLSHIWCACHNGHFDLSGRNIAGPPPSPLAQYDVFERGDAIVVSGRT
jgi:cytochrome b6-f complex iron-sulfur subunit